LQHRTFVYTIIFSKTMQHLVAGRYYFEIFFNASNWTLPKSLVVISHALKEPIVPN